ncbi:MAG: squalene/phytoene synthase family protein [Candidatus Promineifilaceae bacterium]
MHYFIGHDAAAPYDETRYLAVTGAHITHMLRDAVEDAAAGYTNIPQEVLEQHQLTPTDWSHEAYRAWVQQRVQLARHCFAVGRQYLARLESLRCRLAGYAYIARFEVVLDLIEKDAYRLRLAYPERKSKKAALQMCLAALAQTGLSFMPRRYTPLSYPISPPEVLR